MKNLYIKRKDKITLYNEISEFSNKLSNIQGKIYIHPDNKKFGKDEVKQNLVTFLGKMGINAKFVSEDEPKKSVQTLDRWCT